MNIVTLLQPPRIVIGDGCAPHCAEYLAQRGVRRVLLVSSTPVSGRFIIGSALITPENAAKFYFPDSPF